MKYRICKDPHSEDFYVEQTLDGHPDDLWYRIGYEYYDSVRDAEKFIQLESQRPIVIKEFSQASHLMKV